MTTQIPAGPSTDRPTTPQDPPRAPRVGVLGAVAGIVAAAVFLGSAEVVAALLGGAGSPLVAVGSAAIDFAPRGVKDLMVSLFGTGDKAALFVLMFVILAAITAAAGVLETRRPPLGAIVFAVGGLISLVAVSTRSGAGMLDGAPSVVGVAVAIFVLRRTTARLRGWATAAERGRALRTTASPRMTGADVERRSFLRWTVVSAAAALVIGAGARIVDATSATVTAARRAVHLPKPATPAAPVPAGASLEVAGITPYVTPNAEFYRIDTALRVPTVDPDTWKLTIGGMVDKPLEISYRELLDMPLEEHMATLSCVSNEVGGTLVGNALWLGFPIRKILERVSPHSGADMVLSRSVDGFTAGTPLSVLQDDDTQALLAVGMNGHPLPDEHGFPVRMVVPGLYGYVSATKWLSELTVTRFADAEGYWIPRGWSARGPVKLESRIDTPRSGSRLMSGSKTAIAGVAWHPHTAIGGVEVRVDSGDWQRAELADSVSADTWRQWVLPWTPTSGSHTITVRGVDSDGTVQSGTSRPPAPNGAEGWHSVTVTAH